MFSVLQQLLFKQSSITHQVTNESELPALGRKAKPSMDRTWENAGRQTTANLQRAPGFCWLQDFRYQTNEHLFQCKFAMELLLLLKPPPKYHSFHKTCAAAAASKDLSAFQPLCPGLGSPKLSVQYSGTAQLWRSLFFPPCMNHQWWHKVSPTGVMIQVGAVRAVIPWHLDSLMSPREGAAATIDQQLVWRRAKCPKGGSEERVSPSSCFEEEGRKRSLLPFIFLLHPPSTLPSGKYPCLQLNS